MKTDKYQKEIALRVENIAVINRFREKTSSQEKPRGLYHISEVFEELIGPDTLSSYRVVGNYKSENNYQKGQR